MKRSSNGFVLFMCVCSLCAGELIKDGGFETPLKDSDWNINVHPLKKNIEFKGRIFTDSQNPHRGKQSLRMTVENEHGYLVVQTKQPIPIPDRGKLHLSLFYRGNGRLCIDYLERESGKFQILKLQEPVFFRLWQTSSWKQVEWQLNIPSICAGKKVYLRLRFLHWGSAKPSELALDDVSLKLPPSGPQADAPEIEILQPQPLSAAEQKEFGPIAKNFSRKEIRDGLIYRNGKPYFWIGEGEGIGGGRIDIVRLWLARVLQNRFISCSLDPYHFKLSESPGRVQIDFSIVGRDNASYAREIARYQMFSMWNSATGVDRWVKPYLKIDKYPGFREFFIEGNHFRCIDLQTEQGRRWLNNLAGTFYRYLKGVDLFCMEGTRELGYMPSNERFLRGFREFARKKYGSLERANRVWNRSYTSWEQVMPPHLENLPAWTYFFRAQARNRVVGTPMHYDYMIYVQKDLTETLVADKNVLRKWHSAPYATDIRGDTIAHDGYAASDPEQLEQAGVREISLMHRAFLTYNYNGSPAPAETLLKRSAETLYTYNFFRTANSTPVLNIECIVRDVLTPEDPQKAMQRNDIAKFHGKWKFHLDQSESGIREQWFRPETDDSSWDSITVPGCWDIGTKWEHQSGDGWYRKTFVVPEHFLQDFLDGSRKFYLYGKGIAQNGRIWVNGTEVGSVGRWNEVYRFEVSHLLKFGKENQITVLSRGTKNFSEHGIRFYLHLLSQDMVNQQSIFGEAQYVEMLWTYLMQGSSGVSLWNWNTAFRPYMPKLSEELNSVAPVVLPDLRKRKSNVAFLHSWLFTRGIPHDRDMECLDRILPWYNAFVFHQRNPDIFPEGKFLTVTPEQYPVLVIPYAGIVQPETYAHFKQYVRSGGTAIISADALQKTFDTYQETDINRFARGNSNRNGSGITVRRQGKGRVITISGKPDFLLLQRVLKPYMPKAEVDIVSADSEREFPYIEAKLAGDAERKVLYLHNWGGVTHRLTIRLPESFFGWTLRGIRETFRKDGCTVTVALPGSSVAIALLEKRGIEPLRMKTVHPELQKVLNRLSELNRDGDGSRPAVLFLGDCGRSNLAVGRIILPMIADALDKLGYETKSLPAEEWTVENLKRFRMIVLMEDWSRVYSQLLKKGASFRRNIEDYLRNGGSAMFLSFSGPSIVGQNRSSRLITTFGSHVGVGLGGGSTADDPQNCGFGDPSQILSRNIVPHPVTKDVKSVQLYAVRPMRISEKSAIQGIVRTNSSDRICPDAPVIAVGPFGKGRVLFSTDASLFQPFRIENADNARLLMNSLGYLLRINIPEDVKSEFAGTLFITQKQFEQMERDSQ